MKNLRLNAWERLMLSKCLPQSGPLQEIAVYLRILETLRLKEDEQEAVGWQENPETGIVTIIRDCRRRSVGMSPLFQR